MRTRSIVTARTIQMQVSVTALIAMLIAAVLGTVLRPSTKIARGSPDIVLETLVPMKIGDWRIDLRAEAIVVENPQSRATLERIYSQTLNRTYVNTRGDRIMLSLAYGPDQSDSMQVHRPEICYPAQGFVIESEKEGLLRAAGAEIPVKYLVATKGPRREPIIYWIKVGDRVVNTGFGQKLAQLHYGIGGRIPDGMLVRVSSIERSDTDAFETQKLFIHDLLSAIALDNRSKLAGAGF